MKKKGRREIEGEREEKICHDLSSSEQKCSLPLKRPLKPSRVNLFSCSGFFFSLLFSPPPFFLLFLSLSLQNIFRGFLLIVLSAKNCPFKVGCAFWKDKWKKKKECEKWLGLRREVSNFCRIVLLFGLLFLLLFHEALKIVERGGILAHTSVRLKGWYKVRSSR